MPDSYMTNGWGTQNIDVVLEPQPLQFGCDRLQNCIEHCN